MCRFFDAERQLLKPSTTSPVFKNLAFRSKAQQSSTLAPRGDGSTSHSKVVQSSMSLYTGLFDD